MQSPPRDIPTPHEGLQDYCRELAAYVAWEKTYGDDAPRFGLTYRDKAEELLAAARRLAAHPALAGDTDLADRVRALDELVARPVTEARFNRDVIAAGHHVAEQVEDTLGTAWWPPAGSGTVEVGPAPGQPPAE